jgi:serine/threonine protein kinase
VRAEVERLLAEHEEAGGFLSNQAINGLPIEVASAPPNERLPQGVLLAGRFRIVCFIASGGMGAVYKAEDTRLHRFVAIKLMSEEIARNPQYLARFQREAQASSALNHPNICTIYDVGEHQGNAFIAMEFLEGMPLSDRIGRRPLDFDLLLDLAADVADGLEAAHAAEIIHRDIKPSNIFVTTRGSAKILDFGIAKVAISRRPASDANMSTQTASRNDAHLTASGSAVGTVAYMSPEQIRAMELDTRSDLFSFGAVFYEMATGFPPFRGESSGLILKAILDGTPASVLRLNPDLPIEVERIINKCLEKDRDLRYQHASDVRTDLLRLRKRNHDSTRDSTLTAPSSERVLQAAAPKESAVGRSAEVVAMVKEASSRGLRQYLDDESIASITSEDVRERPFLLGFPTDDEGRPRAAEVSLRLVSPDFEPPVQVKKLHIPPQGDSTLCTFLIRPIVAGDLVANLELVKGEEVIVSRPIRTHALSENADVGKGLNVITIPLKIIVHPSLAPFVISGGASLLPGSVRHTSSPWDPSSVKAASPQKEPPFTTPPAPIKPVEPETSHPVARDTAKPGEFTSFFQGPFRGDGPSDMPAYSSQPIEPPIKKVGEFTALFGGASKPPASPSPPRAPGSSFTSVFKDMDSPQPTLDAPKPANPPSPSELGEKPAPRPASLLGEGATGGFMHHAAEPTQVPVEAPSGPSPYTQIISRPKLGAENAEAEQALAAGKFAAPSVAKIPMAKPLPKPGVPMPAAQLDTPAFPQPSQNQTSPPITLTGSHPKPVDADSTDTHPKLQFPSGRSVKLGLGLTLAIIAAIGVFFPMWRGPRSLNSRSGELPLKQGGSGETSQPEMTSAPPVAAPLAASRPGSPAEPRAGRAQSQFSPRPALVPPGSASPDLFRRAAAAHKGYCSDWSDIAKKYPFEPNSELDAPLDQLHSLIGPTGSAWTRLIVAVNPFLLKVGSRYAANPSAPVTLSANFLLFLNRVQGLSEVVYQPGSETPHLTYSLRRLPINMGRVEVTIGNEIMTGEDEQKTFVWTGAPEEVVVKNKAGDTLASFSGPWAAFRFISSATQLGNGKLEWVNENKATVVPDGRKESYDFQLEVDGSVNPFFDMPGLKCVEPSANR